MNVKILDGKSLALDTEESITKQVTELNEKESYLPSQQF